MAVLLKQHSIILSFLPYNYYRTDLVTFNIDLFLDKITLKIFYLKIINQTK